MSKIREMLLKDEGSAMNLLPTGLTQFMKEQITAAEWKRLVQESNKTSIRYASGVLTLLPDSELEVMYARWLLEKGDGDGQN